MSIIFEILICIISSILTFECSKINRIGPIRASAGLTLLSYIDFSIINYFYAINVDYYLALFFGATFVGMSCPTRFSRVSIVISGALFSLIFTLIGKFLVGLGGVLGLSAFLSVFLIEVFRKLHKTIK